jgi:hypothetical protein
VMDLMLEVLGLEETRYSWSSLEHFSRRKFYRRGCGSLK